MRYTMRDGLKVLALGEESRLHEWVGVSRAGLLPALLGLALLLTMFMG